MFEETILKKRQKQLQQTRLHIFLKLTLYLNCAIDQLRHLVPSVNNCHVYVSVVTHNLQCVRQRQYNIRCIKCINVVIMKSDII